MNDIFNFFSPLSFVKSGTVAYNPLINYDWSTTTTSELRYLKDVGSTPAYNASMYFGRGAYLNGVDQTITVPINTTIQTALKRVNGVVTINETSQTLTNYVISGLGVHKDYYLFTRLLTTAEKDSYTNTPEAFYAMAQADSTCVLNMPMCETDGYARNMKSYSEGNELVNNGTFDTNSSWAIGGDSTIENGVGRVYSPDASYSFLNYFIGSSKITTGDACIVRYDVLSTNGVDLTSGQSTTIFSSSTTGRKEAVWGVDSSSISFKRINSITDVTIDNISVKKLSGTYPISNYTTSVRDNAKNLQYGLQTCKFVRDSLGVIQSASNYLECYDTGYANTGLVLLENADYTISFVINLKAGVNGAVVSDFGMLGSHKIRRHTNGYMYFIGVLERVVWQVDGDYQAYFVVKFKADGSVEVKKNNSLLISNSYATTYSASNFIIKECSSKLATTVFRKFIIDDKLTTDEEDTIAFNDAVNKGLLS